MKELLLHDKTRAQLEQVSKNNTHALLITGQLGAGKETVATRLASDLLQSNAESSPYFLIISPDTKSLGIEKIRELQKFLQLKTTGTADIRRAVIIQAADLMTTEAQNALLKLLEEPPLDTVIILTADQPQHLKPTIHSRVQRISLLPPSKRAVIDYFSSQNHATSDIERAYMISNGQMGLLSALLNTSNEHELASNIAEAKKLYTLSSFERLAKVDEISKQKDELPKLLYACKRICITALEQAVLKQQSAAVTSWHKQLKLIVDAEGALGYNPNTKLFLTHLFIQM